MTSPAISAQRRVWLTVLVVLVLDQVTKGLAARFLSGDVRHVPGPFSLQLIYDPATTFTHVARSSWLLGLGVVLLSTVLWWCASHTRSGAFKVGAGLAIGGLVSNMADGLTHRSHGVVDFITLFNNWMDFNLADVAVVTGVTLALVAIAATILRGVSPWSTAPPQSGTKRLRDPGLASETGT